MAARETTNPPHVPVMLAEVLSALSPRDGAAYVDGTFGAGGYTRAILEAAGHRVHVFTSPHLVHFNVASASAPPAAAASSTTPSMPRRSPPPSAPPTATRSPSSS